MRVTQTLYKVSDGNTGVKQHLNKERVFLGVVETILHALFVSYCVLDWALLVVF